MDDYLRLDGELVAVAVLAYNLGIAGVEGLGPLVGIVVSDALAFYELPDMSEGEKIVLGRAEAASLPEDSVIDILVLIYFLGALDIEMYAEFTVAQHRENITLGKVSSFAAYGVDISLGLDCKGVPGYASECGKCGDGFCQLSHYSTSKPKI